VTLREELTKWLEEKWAERPVWASLDVGDGWLPLIKETLEKCFELAPEMRLFQVKEKFGELRIYAGPVESEEALALIEAALVKSRSVCDVCGAEGRTRSRGGWLMTRCGLHAPEESV